MKIYFNLNTALEVKVAGDDNKMPSSDMKKDKQGATKDINCRENLSSQGDLGNLSGK